MPLSALDSYTTNKIEYKVSEEIITCDATVVHRSNRCEGVEIQQLFSFSLHDVIELNVIIAHHAAST